MTALLQLWLSTHDTGATSKFSSTSICAANPSPLHARAFPLEMGTSILRCLCGASRGQNTELSGPYFDEYILAQAVQWDLLPGHILVSHMGHVLIEIVTMT